MHFTEVFIAIISHNMGNHWAWPCGERDRRRPVVKTGRPQPKEKRSKLTPQAKTSLTVSVLRGTIIETLLSSKEFKNQVPVNITSHPSDPERGIVVLQKSSELRGPLRAPCRYKYRMCKLTGGPKEWIDTLEDAINTYYENDYFEFIGAVRDPSGGFYLSFLEIEDGETRGSRFEVECVPVLSISKKALSSHLNANSQEGKQFRAAIEYEQYLFIISEEPPKLVHTDYFVAEFPNKDINEPDFETILVKSIIECQSEGVSFTGLISGSKELYIILNK